MDLYLFLLELIWLTWTHWGSLVCVCKAVCRAPEWASGLWVTWVVPPVTDLHLGSALALMGLLCSAWSFWLDLDRPVALDCGWPCCGHWTRSGTGGCASGWGCCSALILGPPCPSLAKHLALSPPGLWEAGSGPQLVQTLSGVVCPEDCSLVLFCMVDWGCGLKPVYGSAAFSQIVPQLQC